MNVRILKIEQHRCQSTRVARKKRSRAKGSEAFPTKKESKEEKCSLGSAMEKKQTNFPRNTERNYFSGEA